MINNMSILWENYENLKSLWCNDFKNMQKQLIKLKENSNDLSNEFIDIDFNNISCQVEINDENYQMANDNKEDIKQKIIKCMNNTKSCNINFNCKNNNFLTFYKLNYNINNKVQ